MVALVGAGPGDPGLITRLGAELLAQADLVLYDRLVSPEILELAQIARSMVCVDQLPGCHPDRIGAIGKAMVEAAQNGLRVVRLKGGDPILFGRCLEEVEPLIEQGISYQIVPGVTAALGAAAFAGIPVTDRRLASAVALITGHENPTKTDGNLDWQALARFPGTLVFYMAMARLENMTTRLMGHGKSPDTPACIIAQATLPSQRVLVTTLGELVAKARAADLRPPAICMVGPVVDCRATMNWFDRRPLYGKRVLTCRPNVPEEKFGNSLVNRLRAMGASARNIPTLEIVPTAEIGLPGLSQDSSPQWDWLVFSSQPGVQSFFAQLHQLGLDSRVLAGAQVAAVGEQTARALAQHGIRADCTNPGGNAESLAKQLLDKVQGRAVLLVRADRGREVLAQTLQPVCRLVEWTAYRQVNRLALNATEQAWLDEGPLDAVLLTSGNIASALAEVLPPHQVEAIQAGKTAVYSLSPVTSESIKKLGWPIAGEAKEPSMAQLAEVVQKGLASS